jgi:hypothetical protein
MEMFSRGITWGIAMQLRDLNTVSCGVLIICGGGASLWAALEAKEMGVDVLIAFKAKVDHTNNTYIADGFVAAARQALIASEGSRIRILDLQGLENLTESGGRL